MTMHPLLAGLRDFIFPQFCPVCAEHLETDESLCEHCRVHLPAMFLPVCEICGKQLPADRECYDCGGKGERAWDSRRALFHYTDAVASIVHECKFNQNRTLLHYLAAMVCTSFYTYYDPEKIDMVIPMPLSKTRFAQRGYNQAEELCRYLNDHVNTDVLVRVKNTKVQSLIHNAEKRAHNVKGAFTVTRDIAGKRIVLFDDVITTGATTNSAAVQLKEAGAVEVHLFALSMAG